MDAISHVNLPAFNAQFIGSEILTQDIVQYTFHLFLRQEVNGRNSKQISVFIHKNTNLRTPFMKRPRIVTVPRKDRVNSHFGNGLFAEHTQRRLFTLRKNFFRQLFAAGRTKFLFLGYQLIATVALYLECIAVNPVNRLQKLTQCLYTHTEPHIVRIGELAYRYSHHFTVFIEDRSARIAGIYGSIGLYIIFSFHKLLGRGNRPFRYRKRHAVRIPRHTDLSADGQ